MERYHLKVIQDVQFMKNTFLKAFYTTMKIEVCEDQTMKQL